jgi:nitrate reductase assembly molybdenum cofactor insertion protein NarJ
MAPADDVQRLAAALQRPRAGYVTRLEALRADLAATAGEASRQLGLFLDRVGDLTLEELAELHRETFPRGAPGGIVPVATALARAPASGGEARGALLQLSPHLDRLTDDRNPFAYVVRALCCLLLSRT